MVECPSLRQVGLGGSYVSRKVSAMTPSEQRKKFKAILATLLDLILDEEQAATYYREILRGYDRATHIINSQEPR